MFVSVILDSEYMGMGERIKWFIKNLSHAKRSNWLIVTHEYLKLHFAELLQNCSDRFYDEFEMERISEQEMLNMGICFIPDRFFENLEEKYGSRSKMIVNLTNKNFPELTDYIDGAIQNKLKENKREKVEAFFNCLHCFKSIVCLAEKYSCPVIPYVFSAIRKVHGYRQTLYMANMSADLMNNKDIAQIYENFQPEKFEFKLFTNKEILALLGKERNLPLLPLVDKSGVYELGVASEGFRIIPQSYDKNGVTDDDIYYKASKFYEKNQIITRIHPLMLDQAGIGRGHMKNDPVAFILSCRRIATIQSQIIMKAALWNRVPCVLSDALPYAFLLSGNLEAEEPLNSKKLNFIIFCFFIPDECMFDEEYWLWRKTKPSANEIFIKHLYTILKTLGYNKEIVYSDERLDKILRGRGWKAEMIKSVDKELPNNYNYLSSRIRVEYKDGSSRNFFCLNYQEGGNIVSRFRFETEAVIKQICFWALDDIDGWVIIRKVQTEKEEINIKCSENDYIYSPKGKINYVFKPLYEMDGSICIVWKGIDNESYLSERSKEYGVE